MSATPAITPLSLSPHTLLDIIAIATDGYVAIAMASGRQMPFVTTPHWAVSLRYVIRSQGIYRLQRAIRHAVEAGYTSRFIEADGDNITVQ